jgi:hypothetical protein
MYSGYATGSTMEDLVFDSREGEKFSLFHNVQTTYPASQMVPGNHFAGKESKA